MMAIPAFADTIPQTQFFTGIPNMNGSLTFNQFDNHSDTWTLLSIQVSFTLKASGGYLKLDNDSAQDVNGTFEFGAIGSISSTDVVLKNSFSQLIPGQAVASFNESFSLDANDLNDGRGDYDPTPPDGLLYNGGFETGSESGFVGNASWEEFLGTGAYNINYSVARLFNYSSNTDRIEYEFIPVSVSGFVTVLYTYDVIPEPATITLLCTGTLALLKRKNGKFNTP